jgi:hypothetical protein
LPLFTDEPLTLPKKLLPISLALLWDDEQQLKEVPSEPRNKGALVWASSRGCQELLGFPGTVEMGWMGMVSSEQVHGQRFGEI